MQDLGALKLAPALLGTYIALTEGLVRVSATA